MITVILIVSADCRKSWKFKITKVFFSPVDRIRESARNIMTGEYDIPENLIGHGKIQEQLRVLDEKYSKIEKPAKVQKISSVNNPDSNNDSTVSVIKEEASPVIAKQTNHPVNQVSTQSLTDFFKERNRQFAAKDPEKMRAPSPPPSSVPPAKLELPQISAQLRRFIPVVLPLGQMAAKLKAAAPFNVFLTSVTSAPLTHSDPLSITFLEILDPSLGELESSVQLNFTVDINWLLAQYQAAKVANLPLIVLYGQEDPVIQDVNRVWPNIHTYMIKVPSNIGCHHAKVMMLFYKDKSMRIVISTANLYQDDWDNRVQGVWISDRLEFINDTKSGESVTNFRKDFINFLVNYKNPKINAYIDRIRKSDFSSIKACLITSIPGAHGDDSYGHRKLGTLLSKHSAPIDVKHPIIMQSSSLGNFGRNAAEYLTGEVAKSMKRHSGSDRVQGTPEVKLIYPSLKNVDQSHDGMMGGGCLPYFRDAHARQPWLNDYLYQWKCVSRNRDRAMPHIKSYCRYSDDGLFWFVLTSANMSKSAWGVTRNTLNINSYEVGVAFFPRVMLDGRDQFPMDEAQQRDQMPIFKLPFDIPPVAYESTDSPFCIQDMQEYAMSLMALQNQL